MYLERRRSEIVDLLEENGQVAVNDLAQHYDVSLETIRRDLDTLSEAGLAQRVHGGAITVNRAGEPTVSQRLVVNSKEKTAIARKALERIPDRPLSILLDSGTTTGRLAELLPDRNDLTVLTNSVLTAASLSERTTQIKVIMVGGLVRGITQATVGGDTIQKLQTFHPDIAFIGCNGMHPYSGYTTPDPTEAAAKTEMVDRARKRIVLADADKYGVQNLVTFTNPENIDLLISDSRLSMIPSEELSKLAKEVVLA